MEVGIAMGVTRQFFVLSSIFSLHQVSFGYKNESSIFCLDSLATRLIVEVEFGDEIRGVAVGMAIGVARLIAEAEFGDEIRCMAVGMALGL